MARASPGEALAEDDEDVDDVVVPTALAMRTGAMTVTGRVVAVAMVAVEDRSVPATCQPLPSALGVQRGSGNLRSVSRCSRERAWPEPSAGQCEGSGAAQGVWAAEEGTQVSPEHGAGLLGSPAPPRPTRGRSGEGEARGAAAAPASGGLPGGASVRGTVRSAGALGPLQALPAAAQLVLLFPELPKGAWRAGTLAGANPEPQSPACWAP